MEKLPVREDFVIFKECGNLSRIILNNPKKMNVFYANSLRLLIQGLKRLEDGCQNRVISWENVGNKVFSAGGNMKRLHDGLIQDMDIYTMAELNINAYYTLAHILGNMTMPIVTIMNGLTMGGGAMLASFTPFRIATENTKFGMTEPRIGSFADGGACYSLSRLDSYLGRYITLTGNILKAEDVLMCGLATHFMKSDKVPGLLEKLSTLENASFDLVNEVIGEFAVHMDHIPSTNALTPEKVRLIERCFQYTNIPDIIKALQKENDSFATEILKQMSKGSPTGTTVSLENMVRGVDMRFIDCLKMDRHILSIIQPQQDFMVAATALLVEKRLNTEWSPSRFSDIDFQKDILDVFYKGCLTNPKFEHIYSRQFSRHGSPCNRYVLPSKEEIIRLYKHLGQDNTLRYLLASSNFKFGVKQKVTLVLENYCHDESSLIQATSKI